MGTLERSRGRIEHAIAELGYATWYDPVGPRHDACRPPVPSAMVFVPCRHGISHAPDEQADPADAALASHVMLDALSRLWQDR